jgi:hypothetical protein
MHRTMTISKMSALALAMSLTFASVTGIWSTPPYLHSGAVPTLYDLLLRPPSGRSLSFSARASSIQKRSGS